MGCYCGHFKLLFSLLRSFLSPTGRSIGGFQVHGYIIGKNPEGAIMVAL